MAGTRTGERPAARVGTQHGDDRPLEFDQAGLRAVAERVARAFPRPFTTIELVLIDVDPRTVHAFWTVPIRVARTMQQRLGSADAVMPLVLRVSALDDTGAVSAVIDVDVVGLQGRAYVDLQWPQRRCQAEIGVIGRGGVFVALVTSNVALLPNLPHAVRKALSGADTAPAPLPAASDKATDHGDHAARTFPAPAHSEPGQRTPLEVPFPPPPVDTGDYDPALERGGRLSLPSEIAPPTAGPTAGGVTEKAAHAQPAWPGAGPTSPLEVPFPPPPVDTGDYDPALERGGQLSLPSQIALPTAGTTAGGVTEKATHARPEPPAAGPPSPIVVPFPPPPTTAGDYDPALERSAPPSIGDVPRPPDDDDHGALANAAPDTASAVSGAGENGIDTETVAEDLPSSAVFSAFGGAESEHPPALGEVRIDIELFGRTRPGRELYLLGQRVALRPDGTFSCSHRLPNGDAVIALFLGNALLTEARPIIGGTMADATILGDASGHSVGEADHSGGVLSLGDPSDGGDAVHLEVNAIVHISGRMPRQDGALTVLGQPVTPDADGRFTVGRPLPRGALILSALLIGAAGDAM